MGAAQACVDTDALVAVADRYEAAAELIAGAVRNQLSHLAFDGSSAGRAYSAHGDALRGALDDVVAALSGWARSASGIAEALRRTAQHYAEADARAASRLS